MKQRTVLMALGFAAAFCGDALLVFMRCGVRTTGFLFGVLAFSCAHILWMAANRHGVRFEWRALAVVLPPVMGLLAVRAVRAAPARAERAVRQLGNHAADSAFFAAFWRSHAARVRTNAAHDSANTTMLRTGGMRDLIFSRW